MFWFHFSVCLWCLFCSWPRNKLCSYLISCFPWKATLNAWVVPLEGGELLRLEPNQSFHSICFMKSLKRPFCLNILGATGINECSSSCWSPVLHEAFWSIRAEPGSRLRLAIPALGKRVVLIFPMMFPEGLCGVTAWSCPVSFWAVCLPVIVFLYRFKVWN